MKIMRNNWVGDLKGRDSKRREENKRNEIEQLEIDIRRDPKKRE